MLKINNYENKSDRSKKGSEMESENLNESLSISDQLLIGGIALISLTVMAAGTYQLYKWVVLWMM